MYYTVLHIHDSNCHNKRALCWHCTYTHKPQTIYGHCFQHLKLCQSLQMMQLSCMCCDKTVRDITVCPVTLLSAWAPYSSGNVIFEFTTKSPLKVDVLVICQTCIWGASFESWLEKQLFWIFSVHTEKYQCDTYIRQQLFASISFSIQHWTFCSAKST